VLRVALAISAALPAASRYRPNGRRAMTPTPPTTSSTNQPIGSRTGTAKSLIVKGRLTCPSRSPQGGDRVVERDHGTRQDRDAGQGRRPVGDEHAQRQQQDVDEVDQGLAAKAEDRDPGCHGLLKLEREGVKTSPSRTAAAPATAR
jgi:hypothetical protein